MSDEPEMPSHLDSRSARELLELVLEAEKDRIHMKQPRGVNNEIESVIRDEVE